MRVHVEGPVCPGCEKKLEGADPLIARWFRERAKKLMPDAHIACAWRGEDEQDMHFLEGRSKLRWPKSKHNAMKDGKPASRALDLFRLVGRAAEFSPSWYYAIWEDTEKAGLPMRWGGRFKTLGDAGHFELEDELPEV